MEAQPKKRTLRWDSDVEDMQAKLGADAAKVAGVWQTDSSQHTGSQQMTAEGSHKPTVYVPPLEGQRTLRVLYLFSGVARRASIAEHLKGLCSKDGMGLAFFDVDIHVGGSAHNLLDDQVQEDYMSRILEGEYDVVILSPPCGSWSRANWANNDGPAPCRDRDSPWGFKHNRAGQQKRAELGNAFVHFSIRAIQSAQSAKTRGHHVRCLLEHPEDLGRVGPQALHQGVPASIWQLDELRHAFGSNQATTVAGWQCQFPNVDYAKPTRLYSDIPGIEAFGKPGWPIMDADFFSKGPLPRFCGHSHKQKTIGISKDGGFNISPTAAYPEGMCAFIASLIFKDWLSSPARSLRDGRSSGSGPSKRSGGLVRAKEVTKLVEPPLRTDNWEPWTSTSDGASPWLGANEIIPEAEILRATDEANAKGIDHSIKDGIDLPLPCPSSDEDEDLTWKGVGDPEDGTTDEETELAGTPRPQRGAGHWGQGPALRISRKGKHRDFVDGGGLCSPGRWPKERRRLPRTEIAKIIQDILLQALLKSEPALPGGSFKSALHAIIAGKLEGSPFATSLLERTRDDLRFALIKAGYGDGLPLGGDRNQHFEVRLIQALLYAFDDPDALFCEYWAKGVWLGSQTRKLPRTPSVFDRKVKWKYAESSEPLHGEWQSNYPSVREHAATVHKQFQEEEREGLMTRMTLREAIATYGDNLVIAATGAIEKKGRAGEVRVIFDASNGVLINMMIRVRDQVKCPAAGDAKSVLRELHREGASHVCLVYDISKAHRRIPVLEEEWGRQACQVRGTAASALKNRKRMEAARCRLEDGPSEYVLRVGDFTVEELDQTVWLNTVGTFGVGSAGYWWGRAGAALMRLSHYCQGDMRMLWLLLYSDDSWATASGPRADRDLLLHLLVLGVVGTPLAWHKLHGGAVLEWIGYALDVGRFELGVTEKRVQWAVRWIGDKVREGAVRLGELREGLGRLQFVAGPLDHLRPFLGPLYAWVSAGPRYSRPPLPVMIRLILEFFAKELSGCGMAACAQAEIDLGEMFRLDAKAEGDTVAIGGWRCKGVANTKEASWFAISLNRRNAPWAFQKGEAFRTIASLELLGVLAGLMILVPDEDLRGAERAGLLRVSCGTDNLGNTYLLDRLITTKYPLGVVLMEVAHQCHRKGLSLRADWVPRLENQEADDLTNMEFKSFDPKKRIDVRLEELKFGVLNELFRVGDDYMIELDKLKALKATQVEGKKKRLAGESLRERDPW